MVDPARMTNSQFTVENDKNSNNPADFDWRLRSTFLIQSRKSKRSHARLVWGCRRWYCAICQTLTFAETETPGEQSVPRTNRCLLSPIHRHYSHPGCYIDGWVEQQAEVTHLCVCVCSLITCWIKEDKQKSEWPRPAVSSIRLPRRGRFWFRSQAAFHLIDRARLLNRLSDRIRVEMISTGSVLIYQANLFVAINRFSKTSKLSWGAPQGST